MQPPATPSKTLSVSNWRITRAGLAPRAARIANSRVRPVERARRRLATLTQAIKSTKLTAPSSTSRIPFTLPTTSALRGISETPVPLSASGYAAARFSAMRFMSARASSMVTPGFRRPMEFIPMLMRRSRKVGSVHWPMEM